MMIDFNEVGYMPEYKFKESKYFKYFDWSNQLDLNILIEVIN